MDNSYTKIGNICFWTATINKWKPLLFDQKFKDTTLSSLANLSDRNLIDVFAFVVMPNHVHFIWRMNALNGKEKPFGSFLKFTAHKFKRDLPFRELAQYEVKAPNKRYEFWQKNPLAIELYSPEVAYQKLEYIHNNPVSKKWILCKEPSDYPFSSAGFYELGDTTFTFLKHLGEEF